jgi:hypothetical protein
LAKKYELVKCSEIMEEVATRQSNGKRRKTSLPNTQAAKAPSAPISPFGSSVDDMAVDDVAGRIKKEDDEDIPIAVPEYKKPARYVSASNLSLFSIEILREPSFREYRRYTIQLPSLKFNLLPSKSPSNASNITAGLCCA